MPLKKTWRWFGSSDPIKLEHLVQMGVEGVVTALYDKLPGEIWDIQEIRNTKNLIESHGLEWSVVESLPVAEGIKIQSDNLDELLYNYQESLKNLGRSGIRTVVYNFMPVLDWARTNLNYTLASGEGSMYFDFPTFVAFDVFILKRPGANNDYSSSLVERAETIYKSLGPKEADKLAYNIMIASQSFISGAMAGTNSNAREQFIGLINKYKDIDENRYRENLKYFLKNVIPVAEEYGIRMAIHPDDPPFSILGLPRIMSSERDIAWLIEASKSPSNGFTFCAGSLGVNDENILESMIEKHGSDIHFIHLRNLQFDESGGFYESGHIAGKINMPAVVTSLIRENKRRMQEGRTDHLIPFRPDHGNKILDDHHRNYNPGYPLAGRLKGLAELDGLISGIEHMMHLDQVKSYRTVDKH